MPLTAKTDIYPLSWFGEGILAAFSGRWYDARHRDDFLQAVGIKKEHLKLPKQEHTDRVGILTAEEDHDLTSSMDALLTDQSDIALGILTADCIPVFVAAPSEGVVGLIHAGWRGLKKGIIKKAIGLAQDRWHLPGSKIKVALGPAIRSCCYTVSAEFADYFPRHYIPATEV